MSETIQNAEPVRPLLRQVSPPVRVRRQRVKGYRMPEGAVSVTRPGRWGNPFKVGGPDPERFLALVGQIPGPGLFTYAPIETAERAVECFRSYVLGKMYEDPDYLAPLRGKDLACYCALNAACHADVLLDLANRAG